MDKTKMIDILSKDIGFREAVKTNVPVADVLWIDGEYYNFEDVCDYYEGYNESGDYDPHKELEEQIR